ncbi:MAG: DNA repair protein RecN [Candidatus Omnitrophica bacterium]|nr:DNA repair protein RecN [Candidatus Omnitrophota bacterium]
MISRVTIQNFALIDHVSIEFVRRLNIFTGETGAGKSILIDALRFVLGERFDTTLVRNRQKPCTVEAVFELTENFIAHTPAVADFLDPNDDRQIIIVRSALPDNRATIKVNGKSVTRSQLKELGDRLVDFHGAYDHQSLLASGEHLNMLDRLCNFWTELNTYQEQFAEYQALIDQRNELRNRAENRDRELDMLGFQIRELEQVPLEDAPYEDIAAERSRINNAEKLFEHANTLLSLMENDHAGIVRGISQAFSPLKHLADIDASTSPLLESLLRMQEDAANLTAQLSHYLDTLSFDPGRAEDVNRRYDIYHELLRKYGPSLAEVRGFYERARETYHRLANLEGNASALDEQIRNKENQLKDYAAALTRKRQKTAAQLKKTIEAELKELGFTHIEFLCKIEPAPLQRSGADSVSFLISPNAGETLKPLADIVSSGEAARVMLALKKALIKTDLIPVLIFDEIDAQIGGRLGTITGKKLKELSEARQVILITHLPQIASFADAHFKVSKQTIHQRAATQVALLDKKERVAELAKMMSGEQESAIAVKHAYELLEKAKE